MESLKFSFGACGATATYIKTFLPRLRRVDEIAKIFRRRLRRAEKIAKNFRRRLWSVEEIAKNFPSVPAARRENRRVVPVHPHILFIPQGLMSGFGPLFGEKCHTLAYGV